MPRERQAATQIAAVNSSLNRATKRRMRQVEIPGETSSKQTRETRVPAAGTLVFDPAVTSAGEGRDGVS
jgi:hypothetical protein